MKKHALFLFLLLCCIHGVYAQDYYITFIKGDVRLNNKPLKLGDKLQSLNKLASADRSAVLALFNLDRGEFSLDFKQVKAEQVISGTRHSELYTLIVQNFLKPYTGTGEATARGFDLLDFFNYSDSLANNKVLLISGQYLPLRSAKIGTKPGDHFSLCRVEGKDTLCDPLVRNDTALIIRSANFNANPHWCLVKLNYTDSLGSANEYLSPALLCLLSRDQLRQIVLAFKAGLGTVYQNDSLKLIERLQNHLSVYYGQYYHPALDPLIEADLK